MREEQEHRKLKNRRKEGKESMGGMSRKEHPKYVKSESDEEKKAS